MKHLKKLLDAYRATTTDCASELERSFITALTALGPAILDRCDYLRVEKVLAAVIADMREEDAKAAARALAMSKVK